MEMMNKKLFFLLFLSIIIHNTASALWYTRLSDSTVSVTYNASYSTTPNWHVVIPDTVYMNFSSDNVYRIYKVVGIQANAFNNCINVVSISIGNNVTSIGDFAFNGCSALNGKLVIPNSVTTIGASAFNGCLSIDTLVVGANVLTIGGSAFSGCSGLGGKLVIPDGVTSIGAYAFYNCSGLDGKLVVPNSVTSIGDYAFFGCADLDGKLVIPNGVSFVGDRAFYGCSGIDTLVIGENVTTIGNYAFYGCLGISVMYYNSRNCATASPFNGAIQSNLQTLIIGENVTTIPDYAFSGCAGLDGKLVIPNGVTFVGYRAFYGCSGIDTLVIGENVTTIGNDAFFGCSGIRVMYYNSRNCTTALATGTNSPFNGAIQSNLTALIIGENVTSIPNGAFSGCTGLDGKLVIPDSVTTIGDYAFSGCSGIDSLYIGWAVTSIGEGAFLGNYSCTYLNYNARDCNTQLCYSYTWYSPYGYPTQSYTGPFVNLPLQIIEIGDSVQSIPAYAFYGRSSLDGKLIIPNNVTTIGNYAFYNCSEIDTLVIGKNVTTIGQYAFSGCSGIRVMNYNSRNCTTALAYNTFSPFYGAVQSNLQKLVIGGSVAAIPNYAFSGCLGLDGKIVIPDSVATIGIYAFNDCSGIDTLVIGENVTTIGNYAFYGCSSVDERLIIPDGVTTIGNSAFQNCSGLDGQLRIPDKVTVIGTSAFSGCAGIDSLYIGCNVTSIGTDAFSGCNGVRHVYYNASNCNSQLCNYQSCGYYDCHFGPFDGAIQQNMHFLELGDSVRVIPDYAFYGCLGLDSMLLGRNLIAIGRGAFSNCTNMHFSQIAFPSSLQSIGNSAFYNCDNIISVNLDTMHVSIGDSAFADCDRLVNVEARNITQIGNSAFAGCFRLNTVNMGNAVASIGNDAFKDCIRLISPKLSQSLTSIGSNAFKGCSLFEGRLVIPENVASIGAGAYSGCGGITSILAKPQNPPTIFATTFDSINPNIPVYVPCGRVLNYYVTNYWENFPNILEMEPYQVVLLSNNNAMGSATITSPPTCGSPQAIIKATSNEGSHFTHWSDGNTNNPRVLSLTQDTVLTANFTVNQAYITVHSSDSVKGHVLGSGLYVYNAPVVLMATSNEGYHFIHWSDGNTQNPRYVVAKQDSVFTAVFTSNISNVNVLNNNPEMGTVSGSGVYYYQNYATLSATANYGYHFTHWNDGNTDNPRMLFVDRDTTFTASFALNVYAISASSENSTMGSVSGGGNYTYNMQISLTANSNYGYHFSQWSDGNTQNPRNVTVTTDSVFTAQFAANTYTLSVSSNDPDMGSAYGAGTFSYNSQTTISAAANYGYHFTQWSDGNTENPRIVTINGSKAYTAIFAINFYTINVNSSNPALGTASGGGSYNYNSSISITATPNYGYHFTQWSDGNTQNPRTVTVMQNATYTAQFAINTYAVTVNSNNANMGVVLGGGNYIYQTPATLSATPNYGYHFVQWNDGNNDNPRTIIVTQNEVFTAQFDYNTYTLTALSNNYLAGTVSGGGSYNYNSVVSVLAVPNAHYHFVQWSDMLTDNPRNIIMTQDTLITAQFEIDQHTVYVQSSNTIMGGVSGSGTFPYGTYTPISATPNYGYHFVSWSDGSTQNPRTVMVKSDTSFMATFALNQYSVTCQSMDTAMGVVNGSGTYSYMTTVTLQAIPQVGHHFTQWSDGNIDNPRIITLTKDTVLNAQFAINMYTVNIAINDSTMGGASGAGIYPYLSQVTISATAAEHHHFVQWGDGSTSNPRQITVTSNLDLEVIFAEDDRFQITAVASDTTMGYVQGTGAYYAGTQVNLTAFPYEHYQFLQWTDGVTDNPRSFVVLENATYMALFAPLSYDILAYSSNEMMGTVTGGGTYNYHTEVMLQAIAREGYHFVCWNDGDSNSVRTVMVEGNAVYIASFAEGVGVNSHTTAKEVNVYPNPTRGNVFVEAEGVRRLEVYDVFGRLVLITEDDRLVDLSRMPDGVYMIKIITDDGSVQRKIVKE